MATWRLMTWGEDLPPSPNPNHPQDVYLRMEKHQIIAIGWGYLGDLRLKPSSQLTPGYLTSLVRNHHGGKLPGGNPNSGPCLYAFFKEIQVGDKVLLRAKKRLVTGTEGKAVVEITGTYYYQVDNCLGNCDLYHRLNAKWTSADPDTFYENHPAKRLNPRGPLIELW